VETVVTQPFRPGPADRCQAQTAGTAAAPDTLAGRCRGAAGMARQPEGQVGRRPSLPVGRIRRRNVRQTLRFTLLLPEGIESNGKSAREPASKLAGKTRNTARAFALAGRRSPPRPRRRK
jgi:hypothetical protein